MKYDLTRLLPSGWLLQPLKFFPCDFFRNFFAKKRFQISDSNTADTFWHMCHIASYVTRPLTEQKWKGFRTEFSYFPYQWLEFIC